MGFDFNMSWLCQVLETGWKTNDSDRIRRQYDSIILCLNKATTMCIQCRVCRTRGDRDGGEIEELGFGRDVEKVDGIEWQKVGGWDWMLDGWIKERKIWTMERRTRKWMFKLMNEWIQIVLYQSYKHAMAWAIVNKAIEQQNCKNLGKT